MSGYVLHPEAYDDIDRIREYIAEYNPGAADRVITEIFGIIRGLVPLPERWPAHDDLHLLLRHFRYPAAVNLLVELDGELHSQ
jgi:plasmid stabilization system protein ParE